MYTLPQLFADVNACKYLFLRQISEPNENSLRLTIEEGIVSGEQVSLEIGGTVLEGGRPIVSTPLSHAFELVWDRYVAYQVTNESYATAEESDKEVPGHSLLRLYGQSRFLDFIRSTTLGFQLVNGELKHVCLICLNHVVDVVSAELPLIRSLRPTSLPI